MFLHFKFNSLQELFYPYMQQYVKSAQIPKNNLHIIYWEVANDQNIFEIPSHKSLCWKPIKTTMLLWHNFVTAISKSQKHGCIDRSWKTSQKKQNGSSMLICPLFLQLKYTPKNPIDEVFTSKESWVSHSKQLDLPPTFSCKKSCTKGIEPARAVARKKLH